MRRLLALRHTLRRNWQEDPVLFFTRLMRKYPSSTVDALLGASSRLMALAPSTSPAAVLALLSGQQAALEHRIEQALERGPRGRSAKRAAEVCLAAGMPRETRVFLDRSGPDTPGTTATAARLAWYRGEMTEAIEILEDAGARGERLRARFAAELDVFTDWRPALPRVEDYTPRRGAVLHLVTNSLPHTTSGYAQRTHSLLRAQLAEGWEVHAATRIGYPQTLGIRRPPVVEDIDGVMYHRLQTDGPLGSHRDRLQLEAELLLDLALDLRPQVIHTTTHFVNGLVARAVAEALGIPWVYEVRGQLADTWAARRGPEATSTERYVRFVGREREMGRAADAVITLGRSMRRRLVEDGIEEDRIVLAPNSVGESYLGEPEDTLAVRRRLGLERDKVYIGTVSSLVRYEGLDDLVRAFALVHRERPETRLLIVGDGEILPHLRVLATQLGLDPRHVFPGRVPRSAAADYHRALDIFCVPRRDLQVTRSVTPLKPVEAMASGKPVVVSDLPALREMVDDGVNGRTFPAEDVPALAGVLRELVDDPETRRLMGLAGRAMVLSTRTWKRNAQRCIGLYEELEQQRVPSTDGRDA